MAAHGVGKDLKEDRLCARCGEIIEGRFWAGNRGRKLLCPDCLKMDPHWSRGTVYLCVQGVKSFLGGHYRKEEMGWSLILGSWDLGMVFEEWRDKEYFCSWRVVANPAGHKLRNVIMSCREPRVPEQTLEPVDRKPKGDGRILKP